MAGNRPAPDPFSRAGISGAVGRVEDELALCNAAEEIGNLSLQRSRRLRLVSRASGLPVTIPHLVVLSALNRLASAAFQGSERIKVRLTFVAGASTQRARERDRVNTRENDFTS